jgi:hypothetical protein
MQSQPLQVEPGGQQSCTLETIVRTEQCDLQTISYMQDSLTEASVMDGNRALRAKEALMSLLDGKVWSSLHTENHVWNRRKDTGIN